MQHHFTNVAGHLHKNSSFAVSDPANNYHKTGTSINEVHRARMLGRLKVYESHYIGKPRYPNQN